MTGNSWQQFLDDIIIVCIEQLSVLCKLVDHLEGSHPELLHLFTLALISLLDDSCEKLNERLLDQLLLEGGRLEHLKESKHEKLVSSESTVLTFTFL